MHRITYLVIVTTVLDDVHGFDDIGMLEGGTHAKFGSDFLLVLFLRFS